MDDMKTPFACLRALAKPTKLFSEDDKFISTFLWAGNYPMPNIASARPNSVPTFSRDAMSLLLVSFCQSRLPSSLGDMGCRRGAGWLRACAAAKSSVDRRTLSSGGETEKKSQLSLSNKLASTHQKMNGTFIDNARCYFKRVLYFPSILPAYMPIILFTQSRS